MQQNEQTFEKAPATAYETLTVEQTANALATDVENGLSSEEAQRRLEKYGPNKLQEKKKKTWIIYTLT